MLLVIRGYEGQATRSVAWNLRPPPELNKEAFRMPHMPFTSCSLMALFCSVTGPALLVQAGEPFIAMRSS